MKKHHIIAIVIILVLAVALMSFFMLQDREALDYVEEQEMEYHVPQ